MKRDLKSVVAEFTARQLGFVTTWGIRPGTVMISPSREMLKAPKGLALRNRVWDDSLRHYTSVEWSPLEREDDAQLYADFMNLTYEAKSHSKTLRDSNGTTYMLAREYYGYAEMPHISLLLYVYLTHRYNIKEGGKHKCPLWRVTITPAF